MFCRPDRTAEARGCSPVIAAAESASHGVMCCSDGLFEEDGGTGAAYSSFGSGTVCVCVNRGPPMMKYLGEALLTAACQMACDAGACVVCVRRHCV